MEDIFDRMNSKTKCLCCSMSCLVILLTSLLIASFAPVEPTEYGVGYNKLTKSLDTTKVYEGGLNFVGPTRKIFTFPRIHKSIEFSTTSEA